jgi:hypothetical protein
MRSLTIELSMEPWSLEIVGVGLESVGLALNRLVVQLRLVPTKGLISVSVSCERDDENQASARCDH